MTNLKSLRKLHEPVLVKEVIEAFDLAEKIAHSNKRIKIIDATLGLGGHTERLVKSGVQVLGIDEDRKMLQLARERLELACPTSEKESQGFYSLTYGSFKDIAKIAQIENFTDIDGVLFDFGVSSPQLTSTERGFSFQSDDADLDMRIDQEGMGVKGSDLLNLLREDQLNELFLRVLDYRDSKALTNQVTKFREFSKFKTVGDYKYVINKVLVKKGHISPETLPFLALRIAVNSELESISEGIMGANSILVPGGRIVVISFHSGEDKLVKEIFNKLKSLGEGGELTKKPIVPQIDEVNRNMRSRSALLRIYEKS